VLFSLKGGAVIPHEQPITCDLFQILDKLVAIILPEIKESTFFECSVVEHNQQKSFQG
jgi:hypothetical protein